MKNVIFISLTILLLTFTAFGQKKSPAKLDVSKGVLAAFDKLVEGIKQSDVEKVMSVYHNTNDILFFNNNGSATKGWATMKTNREANYAKTSDVTLEITGLRIETLSKDSALLTCKWKQSQTYNDKFETASGRMTLVFKLIGKEWKAIHLHTSPDNPDPSRPVLCSEREQKPE